MYIASFHRISYKNKMGGAGQPHPLMTPINFGVITSFIQDNKHTIILCTSEKRFTLKMYWITNDMLKATLAEMLSFTNLPECRVSNKTCIHRGRFITYLSTQQPPYLASFLHLSNIPRQLTSSISNLLCLKQNCA